MPSFSSVYTYYQASNKIMPVSEQRRRKNKQLKREQGSIHTRGEGKDVQDDSFLLMPSAECVCIFFRGFTTILYLWHSYLWHSRMCKRVSVQSLSDGLKTVFKGVLVFIFSGTFRNHYHIITFSNHFLFAACKSQPVKSCSHIGDIFIIVSTPVMYHICFLSLYLAWIQLSCCEGTS